MKLFKKMMALVIAAAMTIGAMNVTAFAADDYTLTINNTVSGHTYTAYQIFKGTRAEADRNKNNQPDYSGYALVTGSYDENTVYYEKTGADFNVVSVDQESFAVKKNAGNLYTRTRDTSLGDVVWGDDITTAGKAALYEAYSMSVDAANYDDVANIKALVDAIANESNTTLSESDKAVKFANVFFTTDTAGNVTAKAGLLNATPAAKQVKAATGTTTTFNDLASGYYLINDSYTPQEGEQNGIDYSIARIAVQVVGNTTINNKADKNIVKKKLKTPSDLINEKANELGIGRDVNYVVTDKVPDYSGYDYYYLDFNDTMHQGLTFKPESVVVKVGNETLTKLTAPATSNDGKGYYLYANKVNADGTAGPDATLLGEKTFIIAFEDIMKFAVGADIEITYSAAVNSNAINGVDPTTNSVSVSYSNAPDTTHKDHKEGYPGIPANTETNPMGETPKDWTDTYTTKITIHKQDSAGTALEGVEFTLTASDCKDFVVQNEIVYEPASDGTYYLLNDGTYTPTAPTSKPTLTATTGNSGWVQDDAYTGADARWVEQEGTLKKFRPFVIETDQDKTRYIIVEANADKYASTTILYKPKTITTVGTSEDTYKVTKVGKTDASGNLEFAELGAGTYTLSETEVLPGYNDIANISFKIACTLPEENTVVAGTEQCEWAVSDITPTGTVITQAKRTVTPAGGGEATEENAGIFEITIVNQKGAQLPSTGGIGTHLFYLGGAVLVLGAAILLVTKRRVA